MLMDIAFTKERAPLLLAVIALALVGLALIVQTRRNLIQQERFVERQLEFTARSVYRVVLGSLRRPGPFQELRDATGRSMSPRPGPLVRAFFRDLEEQGGVAFVGFFDQQGRAVAPPEPRPERLQGPKQRMRPERPTAPSTPSETGNGSTYDGKDEAEEDATVERPPMADFALPETVQAALRENGEWHGRLAATGDSVYVFGQRLGLAPWLEPTPRGRPVFLLVGLRIEEQQALLERFRRNALIQAGYVLTAAAVVMLLAVLFVRRRALAGRAAVLEQVQTTLLDALPDGLLLLQWRSPGEGFVVAANPAAHAILGVEQGALPGAAAAMLRPELRALVENASASRDAAAWKELQLDSRRLEALAVSAPPPSGVHGKEAAAHTLLVLRDRTELKSLEEDLAQARRLAAVGGLAAGVAHEIRNPLSSLRGFAQYFNKKLADREPEALYARTMVQEADRLDRVVADLLYLARPRALTPTPVLLEPLAEEVARLLQMDLDRHGARLETHFDAPECCADRDALKQALINLVLNAAQALARQGEAARGESGVIRITAEHASDYVVLTVSDNGPGMAPETLAAAFEPFATSRKHGAGLGLTLVEKAMREMGGRVEIQSETGRGARVRLHLPAPSPLTPNQDAVPHRREA